MASIKAMSKHTSLRLFKRILIKFGSNDPAATGTKEFWRRTNTKKIIETNKDCKVDVDVVSERGKNVVRRRLFALL